MAAVLESPVAGLNIYEESNGPISFGYLDSTQYSGDLTWVPVNTTKGSSWTVDTVYYSINGHPTSSSAGLPALMGKLRSLLLVITAFLESLMLTLHLQTLVELRSCPSIKS